MKKKNEKRKMKRKRKKEKGKIARKVVVVKWYWKDWSSLDKYRTHRVQNAKEGEAKLEGKKKNRD